MFAYEPTNAFISSSLKSVENINNYVETIDKKISISKSHSPSQTVKKKKHKGKTQRKYTTSESRSLSSRS